METEERAKLMGWVPQEEFKGDPDKWTSAEEYVDKADNLMPIMRSQNKKYEEQLHKTNATLEATKAELASMKKTVENIVRVNTKVSEREYERALETIRKEQAKAIDENDGDRFKELEADRDALEKNKPEKIEVAAPEKAENPEFETWVKDNTWYKDDQELREYSDYMASVVSRSNPQLRGQELFNAVKDRVQATFPTKFENPNRQEANVVDGGATQGSGDTAKNKTYRDLPADAKKACDGFVSDGLMTKEEYLKEYFEEE